MAGRGGNCEGNGNGDHGGSGGGERDRPAIAARGQGAGRHGQRDRAIAGPRCRRERQPGGIVTGGPGEGAAAGVADAEGLRCGVGAALGGSKGERGRAGADGGRHGGRGHGEGDRDDDGGNPGAATERHRPAIAAHGQGACRGRQSHAAIAGAARRRERQPRGVVAGGPGEGAAAGVADAEGLRCGVGAALGGSKGERGRTGADGGRHGGRGDGEGDGDGDGGSPGAATERHRRRYCCPTARCRSLAVSVTLPLPVPPAGESVNQGALSLAVQVRVPPPVLLMLRVCGAGLAPPWVAVKESAVGLAPMAGGTGAAVTVKVTGTVTGVTPVPPLNVTVAAIAAHGQGAGRWPSESRLPLPVPLAVESVNQAALSLAVQVRVPPPVLLMLRVCGAGLAPPWVAVKESAVGLAPMAGGTGAAVTVKVTGTMTGVTPVPPLNVTVPLLLPTGKVPVVAVRVTLPLPVPLAVESVNHGALSLAVQVRVPPPVLLMLRVCAAGLAPPWVAVKESAVGLAPMAGGTGAAVTVNVTGTVTEEAPVALSITVPL